MGAGLKDANNTALLRNKKQPYKCQFMPRNIVPEFAIANG
jgi:hypothetical protein